MRGLAVKPAQPMPCNLQDAAGAESARTGQGPESVWCTLPLAGGGAMAGLWVAASSNSTRKSASWRGLM